MDRRRLCIDCGKRRARSASVFRPGESRAGVGRRRGLDAAVRRGTPALARLALRPAVGGHVEGRDAHCPVWWTSSGRPCEIRGSISTTRAGGCRAWRTCAFRQRRRASTSPLAAEELTARVQATTSPTDRILVFGLRRACYVNGTAQSASRFFWSRRSSWNSAAGGQVTDRQACCDLDGAVRPRRRPAETATGRPKHRLGDFFMSKPPLRAGSAGYVLADDDA